MANSTYQWTLQAHEYLQGRLTASILWVMKNDMLNDKLKEELYQSRKDLYIFLSMLKRPHGEAIIYLLAQSLKDGPVLVSS